MRTPEIGKALGQESVEGWEEQKETSVAGMERDDAGSKRWGTGWDIYKKGAFTLSLGRSYCHLLLPLSYSVHERETIQRSHLFFKNKVIY